MLTTKLLPEKENTRQNSFACLKEKKRKKKKVGCLVFLKKLLCWFYCKINWEVANSFVFTVISIPRRTRLNLNEKIKTYNLCTDGIFLVIAVEGLKEFHDSISKCYAH